MPSDRLNRRSWIAAIDTLAAQEQIALPPMTDYGMGSLSWHDNLGDRLVSFKRRLVPLSEAERSGVEWSFWSSAENKPVCVASFRDAISPTDKRVAAVLSVLKGWLLDSWSPEQAKRVISQNSVQQLETRPSIHADDKEFWLSEDNSVGFVIRPDGWRIYSRTMSLATWQSRFEEKSGDELSLASLDRVIVWLADHWREIAHGIDRRPPPLQHQGVAASRAYDNAKLDSSAAAPEVNEWWARHAMRAADEELPNIFFERQADELLISWDATPSQNRFYKIYSGEHILPVTFAAPKLRQLIQSRLPAMQLTEEERSRLLREVSNDSAAGYATLRFYNPSISSEWLTQQGFSDRDAQQLALGGTGRHPIVGLLRSSYGTSINVQGYELVLGMLQPSDDKSFEGLRTLSKGINSHVDVREPWESGYRLARLIRQMLNLSAQDDVNVELVCRDAGIDIRDADFSDPIIRGVCVGAPAYKPLIIINRSSPDASGPSGRRITLAHELCHLLFDRSRLRNLARFDWDAAENDRLLEMRANAFAVELLVPMDLLVKPDGKVLDDSELGPIAASRSVSAAALRPHAQNLRNRLVTQ
ncbi:MAG TPA: ImmA/IrrE family metallo-endopeptidase [Pirellulales bacterium]|nr:ImmA/IrrE family metallo-endopeptidase [Pirellulales bacterium]